MANGHGGARANAGRPPRGDVARIHIYLTSAARRRVRAEAQWRGVSVSEYVESLILAKPGETTQGEQKP